MTALLHELILASAGRAPHAGALAMNEAGRLPPSITVVVVSDYEQAAENKWNDERRILRALAGQDLDEAFPVILVEHSRARDSVPDELFRILPGLNVIFCEDARSAGLKNCGAQSASSEYVAVLEADCEPNRQWLGALVRALRQRQEVSIASGRTTYGNESMYRRCLTLLDRSFDDLGRPGVTPHVSNNGALYRRAVLETHPYPESISPFQSARMRMEAMRRAGVRFWFEPEAVMRHEIGGWNFMRDFRRHTGYSDMSGHSRRATAEIPRLLWRRFCDHCSAFKWHGPRYLRWRDWPLAVALLFVTLTLEIPGMLDALQGRQAIPDSSYR